MVLKKQVRPYKSLKYSVKNYKYDNKKHYISFYYALRGIKLAFETQPNFRLHLFFFALAMLASFVYKITFVEYLAVIIVSLLVFSMEMVNTAIEAIGDAVADGKVLKLVGVAKDVSAGAVLISVLGAILVGFVIFIPKLFENFLLLIKLF